MAAILYVWELGGGLGHLIPGLALADAYRAQGHTVSFVVRDIAALARLLPGDAYPIYQAPIWLPKGNEPRRHPVSFPEILLGLGFGNGESLASMVRAWLRLFHLLRPSLIVLDFSPTATLAAQLANIKHCFVGPGFFIPPVADPIPGFLKTPDARLRKSEDAVLSSINHARCQFDVAQLKQLSDFLISGNRFLTTWKELDHYPTRKNEAYWGPVLSRDERKAPEWRFNKKAKIFIYLFGDFVGLRNVLDAALLIDAEILVYAPGISKQLVERYSLSNILFSSSLYSINQVLLDADLLLCHGSFGTVCEALLAGTPILCFPLYTEHKITAENIAKLGISATENENASAGQICAVIEKLLSSPTYKAAASSASSRYGGYDAASQIEKIALMSLQSVDE